MFSVGDFIDKCSVLLLVIEELEIWSIAEDNLVDDSLSIVVISVGDFMHISSVLLLVIENWKLDR